VKDFISTTRAKKTIARISSGVAGTPAHFTSASAKSARPAPDRSCLPADAGLEADGEPGAFDRVDRRRAVDEAADGKDDEAGAGVQRDTLFMPPGDPGGHVRERTCATASISSSASNGF